MGCEWPDWLGVGASISGIVGSVLLAIPMFRNSKIVNAITSLSTLADQLKTSTPDQKLQIIEQVRVDLDVELLRNELGNRKATRIGAIALGISFALILLQSILKLIC